MNYKLPVYFDHCGGTAGTESYLPEIGGEGGAGGRAGGGGVGAGGGGFGRDKHEKSQTEGATRVHM